MTGLGMLLKSMGINIDPVQVEQAWEQSKDALPRLARSFEEMNQKLARIDAKLDRVLAGPDYSMTQTTVKYDGENHGG